MGYGPIKHFTDKAAYLFPNSSFLFSLVSWSEDQPATMTADKNVNAQRRRVSQQHSLGIIFGVFYRNSSFFLLDDLRIA